MRSTILAAAIVAGLTPLPALSNPSDPTIQPALVTDCLADPPPGTDRAAQGKESCIGLAAAACMEQEGGYSTYGMSECLGQEYTLWDQILNDTYGQVMDRASSVDEEMSKLDSAAEPQVPALRDAQRRWIAWRDAASAFERTRWGGGTGGGPAAVQCMRTLTARQALWLEQYLGEN